MCGVVTGFWQAGGGANGRRVHGCGRVGAQRVVEGGRNLSLFQIPVSEGGGGGGAGTGLRLCF